MLVATCPIGCLKCVEVMVLITAMVVGCILISISSRQTIESREQRQFLRRLLIPTSHQDTDLSRMNKCKHPHRRQHQARIEQIEEYLMGYQVSIVSLDVFDESEQRTDENEGTADVECHKVFLPWV